MYIQKFFGNNNIFLQARVLFQKGYKASWPPGFLYFQGLQDLFSVTFVFVTRKDFGNSSYPARSILMVRASARKKRHTMSHHRPPWILDDRVKS